MTPADPKTSKPTEAKPNIVHTPKGTMAVPPGAEAVDVGGGFSQVRTKKGAPKK